jgi:hypothetical protein
MDTHATRRRWRLEPAPEYAGPLYRKIVVFLFFVTAALYCWR